jgi:hypothetical protein
MALATAPLAVRMAGVTVPGPAMATGPPVHGRAGGELTLALQAHGLVSLTLSRGFPSSVNHLPRCASTSTNRLVVYRLD